MIRLPKDWKEFIESLNSHQVEYVIIGAHALRFPWVSALHRRHRYPDSPVRRKTLGGWKIFCASSVSLHSVLSATDFLVRERVIQLGLAPNRIDLLTSLTGIEFDEAWKDRVNAELDGLPVVFLSPAALIRNKRATGRTQDIADADALEQK